MVEVYHLAARHLHDRALGGTQTSSVADDTTTAQMQTSQTSAAPTPTMTQSNGSGGPTSSPLLFFVALGFGVVFTNLWYDPDPINLENMPARPHRRRREKKLMTMDEVNDRFPLTKYKNWVASRAREGLPTAGGVTASPSRAGSLRNVDGAMPSSPVDTKHSINTRPATANSEGETAGITVGPTSNVAGNLGERKSMEANVIEKENATTNVEEHNSLEQVRTTTSTVNKHATTTSEVDEDDEDDHIHTAVPPELLTNPGDSCAICIDTLEEDDDIRGLTCGHAFHAGCLDPWLTSRRACCPLCKADYYTPKPRPEGEAVEAERSGRRSRDPRINMPQAPTSAWTGIRGNPRFILPGRFGASRGGHAGDNAAYGPDQTRRGARRARRQADVQAQPAAADAGAAENQEQAAPRRWNPFSSVRMPRLPGRNRQQDVPAAQNATAEPSPSQLEAGVVR
ncbi:putative E3 ubiquitin-protein ligase [Halenospora varia]|nr:putative E3 ubiquitin-protein ligase [Halenospora varia]